MSTNEQQRVALGVAIVVLLSVEIVSTFIIHSVLITNINELRHEMDYCGTRKQLRA